MSLGQELPALMARCDAFALTDRKKAARNLCNTGIYLLPDIAEQRAYELHWLIHVRTPQNSFADTKCSNDNLKRHLPSLYDAGYVELHLSEPGFEAVWEAVLGACRSLGTAPSNRSEGPNYLGRRFFARAAELAVLTGLEQIDDSLLATSNQRHTALQTRIAKARQDTVAKRRARLKDASTTPQRILRVVESFARNADVIAERLHLADGICESCDAPAPFLRAKDGTPFLEVHHTRPLSDGGADTVINTKALCPNCHRQAHFG